MRVLLLCLLTLVAGTAHADDKDLRQKIVGTWKLVSVVYEDQDTKGRTPVYGEHPRGRQIATADGVWLALVTAEGRAIPKTDEERSHHDRLYRPLPGRGRQSRDQGRGCLERSLVGGEQTRFIRFEGDRLFIESPPMPHPNHNNRVVRVIVIWDREK